MVPFYVFMIFDIPAIRVHTSKLRWNAPVSKRLENSISLIWKIIVSMKFQFRFAYSQSPCFARNNKEICKMLKKKSYCFLVKKNCCYNVVKTALFHVFVNIFTTLLQRYNNVQNITLLLQRCSNVSKLLHNIAIKMQHKRNVVATSCVCWVPHQRFSFYN